MIANRIVGCAAAAMAAVLASAVAGAAEIVVLESSASAYSAGQILAADSSIKLVSGEAIVLVTEDARLLRVEGPHDGPATGGPAPERSGVRQALAQLVGGDQPRLGGVGAVRGDEDDGAAADTRPDPWLIHAEIGGDQCALRTRPVVLWREAAGNSASAEITDAASAAAATVRWPEAESRATWSADALPPSDARVYLVRFADATRSVAIRLHLVEPAVTGDELAAAAWLAAKGCTPQARMLLR